MPSLTFRDALLTARTTLSPILAFNIFDLSTLLGVLEASVTVDAPVICQYSARTVAFYGADLLAACTRRAAARIDAQAFLHLDHCTDPEILRSCIEASFDGVMFDGSSLPVEQNIAQTIVWREHTAARGVVLEAEFSAIAGEEDGHAGATHYVPPVDERELRAFIDATNPDIVGADIGTRHGHYSAGEPFLDFSLISRLGSHPTCPFVVHGGSGLTADTLQSLASAGVAKLNISTDLKDAWREGMHDQSTREPLSSIRAARDSARELCLTKWVSLGRRSE